MNVNKKIKKSKIIKKQAIRKKVKNNFLEDLLRLPDEMFIEIFSYLTVNDISNFALINNNSLIFIRKLLITKWGMKLIFKKLVFDIYSPEIMIEKFEEYGELMKLCYNNYAPRYRINKIFYCLKTLFENITDSWFNEEGPLFLPCLAHFFKIFLSSSKKFEYYLVADLLSKSLKISPILSKIINNPPGSFPIEEKIIWRYYYYFYYNSCWESYELLTWAEYFLRPFTLAVRARMIFLIFGPYSLENHTILWNCFTSEIIPISEAYKYLLTIGNLFNNLQSLESSEWTHSTIVTVFNELIGTPLIWKEDFVAMLLLFSGYKIAIPLIINAFNTSPVFISNHLSCILYITNKYRPELKHLTYRIFKEVFIQAKKHGIQKTFNDLIQNRIDFRIYEILLSSLSDTEKRIHLMDYYSSQYLYRYFLEQIKEDSSSL